MPSQLELTAMQCAICGMDKFSKLYTINSYDILKCNNCDIIFANVRISAESRAEFLNNIYTDDYFTGDTKNEGYEYRGYEKNYFAEKGYEQTHNAHRRLKIIERLVPPKGRLLDIGCAAGFFLNTARNRGWQPFGLELSETAANFARDQFKLDVLTGTFEDADLPGKYYDVITVWDVIEHVLHPQQFIRKIFTLLKQNGLLVIGTPNVGSLAYKLRRKKWYHFKPPEHIFYYNPDTLKQLLELIFDEVNTSSQYPPYSKINPNINAHIRRMLYSGFNILAKIVQQDEYVVAYARKRK